MHCMSPIEFNSVLYHCYITISVCHGPLLMARNQYNEKDLLEGHFHILSLGKE